MRFVRSQSIVTALLCLSALLVIAARASAQIYHANLTGAQEVPPVATSASGAARIEINEATGTLTFTIVFNNLSSNQTLSHIHAPAAIGATVGVAINFGAVGGTSGTIQGTTTVTPTQLSQIRSGLGYVNVHSANFPSGEIRGQIAIARPVDFDGDGRTDLSVLRFPSIAPPGVAQITYHNLNSTAGYSILPWGDANTDFPAPGDYDGDGRNDHAVYRAGANPGDQSKFFIHYSSNDADVLVNWGLKGDQSVAADYDGDGKTDVAVFRQGAVGTPAFFYIVQSRTQTPRIVQFGLSGDSVTTGDVPVPADYDRDGTVDIAVLRPATNQYFVLRSSDGVMTIQPWGNFATDFTVPGDVDGDGKADLTAARTGASGTSPMVWWQLLSGTGSVRMTVWGISSDRVVPGDYDGDGRIDTAIFRPSTQTFWYIESFTNSVKMIKWGALGDFPTATYPVK